MIRPAGLSRKALMPALLLSASVLFTTGCAMQQFSDTGAHSLTIKGTAFGGQPPVTNSAITLYATGNLGYGSAATVLGTATTDGSGNFSITSAATCADPQQIYIVASGGNPGATAGTNNTALKMVAALGNCSSVSASTSVNINEVTTIAAAYALSGFADNTINIGTSASNPTGLQHAFQNAANIVNFTTGTARTTTPAGNGAVPTVLINTLADILEPCVNSTGPGSVACTALFPAAQPPAVTGIAAPTTTWQAALDMAQYPANNTAALYALVLATPSFGPTAPATIGDLSIGIIYSAGFETNGTTVAAFPFGIAADANDNEWVTGMTSAGLVELSSTGNLLSPAAGGWGNAALQAAFTHQVAADLHGNIITVDNATPSNIYIYNPTAATTTVIPTTIPALSGAALDSNNNLWVSNRSTTAGTTWTLAQFAYSGGAFATSPTSLTGSPVLGTDGAYAITVDATTNTVWAPNQATGVTNYFLSPYTAAAGTITTGDTTNYAAAIDKNGNTWIAGTKTGAYGSHLFMLAKGTTSSPTTYTSSGPAGGLGMDGSRSLMIDGNNRIFVNSFSAASIVEFDPSLGGGTFFLNAAGNGYQPYSATGAAPATTNALVTSGDRTMSIDAAGAIWTVNAISTAIPVTQILGIAAPTNAILAQGKYGVKP